LTFKPISAAIEKREVH